MSPGESGRSRVSATGRALAPEEVLKPGAYRPSAKGRGLHAILEPANPWRMGKPVPRAEPLERANVLLLWFRLGDKPIEGSPIWEHSAEIVAPAIHAALRGLAAGMPLVVEYQTDPGADRTLANPSDRLLVRVLRRHFDHGFRAYVGTKVDARRAPRFHASMAGFVRSMARDLRNWLIVMEECFDAGALEIWSNELSIDELAARIDLGGVNRRLAKVQLAAYLG